MKRVFPIAMLFLLAFAQPSVSKDRFFEVKARKFVYNPNVLEVDKGDRVTIRLISEDVTHGLYIDGYEVNTKAFPGQDGSISFVATKPGRFTFRCSVTCGEFHPYMIGYLNVKPNTRFYLYAALALIAGFGSILAVFLKKKSES